MAVVVNQLEQVNQFSGLGEPNAAYLGQTFTVPVPRRRARRSAKSSSSLIGRVVRTSLIFACS